MKYDESRIDPELRKVSPLGKVLPFIFGYNRLKVFNKLTDLMLKGKCKSKMMQYTQHWITGKDGNRIRICIYTPSKKKTEKLPGLLWIHGGGYGMGSPEMDEKFIQTFMRKTDCVIIAPEYRLSIDEPYPAALNDCYSALLWMKHNADKLGVRSNQIMIGGESAGGGLTAALTLYARDRGTVNVSFQMPLYPMIDDRMTTESSKNNYYPVWNSVMNYKGWKYYLGDLFETDRVPEYAAPSRAVNYENLPPTCTFIGSLEPFRDETKVYINNLIDAGVTTYFREYPRSYHGFDKVAPDAKVSKEATSFLLDTFQYATEHYFAEQNK